MTTLTTNTRTDLSVRGRQMQKAREMGESQVWRLTNLITAFWARAASNPQEEITKRERREAARRAVENLLR